MGNEQKNLSEVDRFGIVIDTIPGYVSWISSELKYLGVNQAIADAFGFDRNRIVGQALGAKAGAQKDDFYRHVAGFFASPKTQDSFEVKIRVGGNELWHLVEAKKYNGGQEALFIGIDITARKQAEAALVAAHEQRLQDARLATLGEIAASIVHEIKSPLNTLIGNADLLAEYPSDVEKVKRYTGKIQKTGERICKIIKALQNQSRQGAQDPFLPASLQEIVGDTLELCQDVFRRLSVEFRPGEFPANFTFDCRATQIGQVLLNLLRNSAEAVEALPEKWVSLEYKDKGDRFEIWITDSGPGIPAEVRKKLMQPFFTTKGIGKGTGIGLSLSRRITKEHNGEFRIDEKCSNTRFVIELPKKHTPPAAELSNKAA